MSSLLSVLQQWVDNHPISPPSSAPAENPTRQDYDNLVGLIHGYQKCMTEYQSNMNTYLLLLASLQRHLNPPMAPTRNAEPNISSSAPPAVVREPSQSNSTNRRRNNHARYSGSGSSSSRRDRNRSYASVAASRNPIHYLQPMMSRYQPIQNNRVSESVSFTSPNRRETRNLIESLLRGNSGRNIDVCGNSLFGNTAASRWNFLFPPLSSSSSLTSSLTNGNGIHSSTSAENTGNNNTEPAMNLIDIVFEYDDSFPSVNNPERESSLQRMLQNEGFRNQILRAAGVDNQSNIMRWIVAPQGLDSAESRGLTNEEIRGCTESLVYEEGMEGLLSTVCPITMEEFVVGDRLLQLRECRHSFRERELVEWFQRHTTCPVCRRTVAG